MNPLSPVVATFRLTRHCQRRLAKQYAEDAESVDDPVFGFESAAEIAARFRAAETELEDMAIVALVGVFQAKVLDHVQSIIDRKVNAQTATLEKAILAYGLKEPDRWRFAEVLDLYKTVVDPDTVGLVKQVYGYWNWLAHGRRTIKPINVRLDAADECLSDFLSQACLT
jgi:hypothetical protein